MAERKGRQTGRELDPFPEEGAPAAEKGWSPEEGWAPALAACMGGVGDGCASESLSLSVAAKVSGLPAQSLSKWPPQSVACMRMRHALSQGKDSQAMSFKHGKHVLG